MAMSKMVYAEECNVAAEPCPESVVDGLLWLARKLESVESHLDQISPEGIPEMLQKATAEPGLFSTLERLRAQAVNLDVRAERLAQVIGRL